MADLGAVASSRSRRRGGYSKRAPRGELAVRVAAPDMSAIRVPFGRGYGLQVRRRCYLRRMRGPARVLRSALIMVAVGSGCSLTTSLEGYAGSAGRSVSTQDAAPDSTASLDAGEPSDPYTAAVLADRPIGYWKLDEKSGGTAFAMVGPVHGTYSGDVQFGGAGAMGGFSPAFDGSDEYVDLGSGFGFEGRTAYSIELWAKRTTTREDQYRTLLSKSAASGSRRTGWHVFLLPAGDPLEHCVAIETYDGTSTWDGLLGTTSLAAGVWYHVVFTFASDGTSHVFLNGGVDATGTNPLTIAATPATAKIANNSDGVGNPFRGQIDEVALYDRALTPAQVQAHYDARK